jgi:hypothetical protein
MFEKAAECFQKAIELQPLDAVWWVISCTAELCRVALWCDVLYRTDSFFMKLLYGVFYTIHWLHYIKLHVRHCRESILITYSELSPIFIVSMILIMHLTAGMAWASAIYPRAPTCLQRKR